jgi:hypothetical protein
VYKTLSGPLFFTVRAVGAVGARSGWTAPTMLGMQTVNRQSQSSVKASIAGNNPFWLVKYSLGSVPPR